MPWKIEFNKWKPLGGNFETVAVTCERTWKECVIVVANYLWCEVVSDVVDYLTKEEMIWVLVTAIAIASTILIRIKYCKKIHAENIVFNKQILNKVGHKIHDLELKINVLTYKMQYGTWPLPHQIYNLNPKKLRKNRMTLSNPNDRKKGSNLSKNEDSILQRQNVQFLPLNSNEINRQFSRTFLTQNGKYSTYSTNNTYNLCQKFTDTVHKCKSFLNELEYNNKRLHSLSNSSETSKASSLKIADSVKQITFFMTEKREASHDSYIMKKEKKINKMKCMKKEKDKIENIKELYSPNNVNISTGATVLTNNDALPKELVSIFPISQPTHNVQSSREILYEVKKRLRSLHNVLRTYQNISRSSERQKSIDKINEIDAFTSIEKTGENKIDINCNSKGKFSEENLPQIQCSVVSSSEYFEFDCTEESSSSLAEYSPNISKAYQYSNDVILQNEDITKTTLFNPRKKISEIVSGKICYISSTESLEDQNIQIQNKTSSIKNFTTKKCRDIFDEEQCQENVITSQKSGQSKISNDSDREDKSTTLLLQEALHFKKALLTRVQSKKECPIDSIKENNIKDELLPELNNNNFPSIIIDIKMEKQITNNSHEKVNQYYIYLEMKQRHDLFPEYLQKINAFAHHESKRNIENQNHTSETSSQYFSITDLTIRNSKVGNNVSMKPPVYEKVISIVIPVRLECQSEIDINEKLIQTKTVLGNIKTCVNSQKNFRINVDNIDNNVTDKHSSTIKFEDHILEHIKNIRDYIDTFLQSQNRAISKACKVLQYQSKRDILRCLNETSHIILHNRLSALSNCNNTDHVNSLNSSNLLLNAEPNYKQQISIKNNTLKCYSDICLRRNPEMFMPLIKDKFSNKNNMQHLTAIELKRKEDLSRPATLKYYYKNRSKSTDNLDLEKYIMPDIKNGKINKKKNS